MLVDIEYHGSNEPPPPFSSNAHNEGSLRKIGLTVIANDPIAPIEVTDVTGKIQKPQVIHREYQRTVEFLLQPGFYRVRLVIREGEVVDEKIVDLNPEDEMRKVFLFPLKPPEGGLKELVNRTEVRLDPSNGLHVSEESGTIMSAQLSTILALAGRVLNYPRNDLDAPYLRSLGLKPFEPREGMDSGLQILLGWETNRGEDVTELLSGIKLHVWSSEGVAAVPVSLDYSQKVPGLAEFSQSLLPGHYWISIKIPGQKEPTHFPLALLNGRITMLIFHRTMDHEVQLYQYMPSLNLEEDERQRLEKDVGRLVNYRRIELLQRFYINGRLDHAYGNAWELLKSKWQDPISGCLGAYLLIRLGKIELHEAVRNMVRYFGGLSDSHVLEGEYRINLEGEIGAIDSFHNALDVGIPIFADGLELLYRRVLQFNISHQRRSLLEAVHGLRTRGLLWSAWTGGVQALSQLREDALVNEMLKMIAEKWGEKFK